METMYGKINLPTLILSLKPSFILRKLVNCVRLEDKTCSTLNAGVVVVVVVGDDILSCVIVIVTQFDEESSLISDDSAALFSLVELVRSYTGLLKLIAG